MESTTELLIIGIGGHVLGIDPSTGTEIWRRKLAGSDVVTISPMGRQVFAGANGELFCLDASDGQILWHNKLKRLGMGIVAFGSSGEASAIAAVEAKRRQAAAVSAAT